MFGYYLGCKISDSMLGITENDMKPLATASIQIKFASGSVFIL